MRDNMEWDVSAIFTALCTLWGKPDIYLFVSRLNCKTDRYFSWRPDPAAYAVNNFSDSWSSMFFCAFPPYNLIGRILQKIEVDNCRSILIVPYLPVQSWFPKFVQLCCQPPVVCSRRNDKPVLTHPRRNPNELPNEDASETSVSSGLRKYDLSAQAQNIVLATWQNGTKKQYKTYLQQWNKYCMQRKVNCMSPTVEEVIEFLT